MKKIFIGALLAIIATSCQKNIEVSTSKNIFEDVKDEDIPVLITANELIGKSILYSHQDSQSHNGMEIVLREDNTGSVVSSYGSSNVTWKLQHGRVILTIENLSTSEAQFHNGLETIATEKHLQYIITKTEKDGTVLYSVQYQTMISYDTPDIRPELRDFFINNLKITKAPLDWGDYLHSGERYSIDLDLEKNFYGLLLDGSFVNENDGKVYPLSMEQDLKFIDGEKSYTYTLLEHYGDIAFALVKFMNESNVITSNLVRIVKDSFSRTLTSQDMVGIYKLGDTAVYRFHEDGIFDLMTPEYTMTYSWKIESKDSGRPIIVMKRWAKIIPPSEEGNSETYEYILDRDEIIQCAQDIEDQKCFIIQERKFLPLSLSKTEFYTLRTISYNTDYTPNGVLEDRFTHNFAFYSLVR